MFFTPRPFTLGEKSIGFTAGRGSAGEGEVDLRIEGEEPNELRRLAASIGGFMGRENEVGVPGVEGAGEAITAEESTPNPARSGGAGLPELTRLGGRSIFEVFPCCESVNCPSFVFRV